MTMNQRVLTVENNYKALDDYLLENHIKKIFLVKSKYFDSFSISAYFKTLRLRLGIDTVEFTHYHPNPEYSSVVEGEKLFTAENCDCIFACGGGSCIDVAKCIKLYYGLDENTIFLSQTPIENPIPLIVLPTTAGSGSEATRYAVIYYNDEKQSVTHDSIIPSAVIFDPQVLEKLPEYQRKSTMLDAFCHAVEAYWSVNSTCESKKFSKTAIQMLLKNYEGYLRNESSKNQNMQIAANFAGKAINITQTTAGHAMCYKLTSIYGIAHGHAAALCVKELWQYMIGHTDLCLDKRGRTYLDSMFMELAAVLGESSAENGAKKFRAIFDSLKLPLLRGDLNFELLKRSVNPIRLKNNPVRLDENSIDLLYHKILMQDKAE